MTISICAIALVAATLALFRWLPDDACDAVGRLSSGKVAAFRAWLIFKAPRSPECKGTPLLIAVSRIDNDNSRSGIAILIRSGVDIGVVDPRYGGTALQGPASWGDWQSVEALLNKGVNPNIADSRGVTPLMYACAVHGTKNDFRTPELLVRHGARLDTVDKNGWDAAQYCKQSKNDDLYGRLIKLKVDGDTTVTQVNQ